MNALNDLIWTEVGDDHLNKVRHAKAQSDLATARVQGMKLRAELTPPTAAKGPFPFKGHRTCAKWINCDQRRSG